MPADGARQLIYCSRTVQEIEKALAELERLIEYRVKYYTDKLELATEFNDQALFKLQVENEQSFLALGLSARKNLCIHPEVSRGKTGKQVDAQCQSLTA